MTGSEPGNGSAGPAAEIDSTVPQSARVYNYWLAGKDHYAVDRAAGEHYERAFPEIREQAQDSRAFLTRAVRYLVESAGIRQFLDLGTGLPTAENTHEVAQRLAPDARVVYVDNDPLVLAHARALLTSTHDGATDYLHADLRDPDEVLAHAARTLDFSRPVALMLIAVLGHTDSSDAARAIVHRLLAAMPAGSYLVVNDATDTNPEHVRAQQRYNTGEAAPYRLHTPEELAQLFDGLETVGPGLVPTTQWQSTAVPPKSIPADSSTRAGIGRKQQA